MREIRGDFSWCPGGLVSSQGTSNSAASCGGQEFVSFF